METATQLPTYTREMAEAAAEKLPPALTAKYERERMAVCNPLSLIPVDADLAKVRLIHYEYVDFVVRWFAVDAVRSVPRWIVEAHPEWGPMGH